jgi:hypothetical protein
MALTPGARFGPYEITALIGVGGMGEVYRATDTTLEREVAIKVLPESLAADADRIVRFEREAKTLASLNHPNIAHLYGLERGDGVTALLMELVAGPTLAERIAQGPIPADEALNVAMQIAAALEAAHAQGVVHRDLKPANIKLRPDGTVKVLDFGLAKAFETRTISGPQAPALTTPAMTQAGTVLGTAAYMAPEQARGKQVDQRADIWAFGVVLYEMLTGKLAFGGEDVTTTLARVLERDPDLQALPASLAPAVRQTLQLCLQKDLKTRIADIRDVRLALAGAFDSSPQGARASSSAGQRARLVAAGLVAGVLLAGAVLFTLTRPVPLPPPRVTRFLVTPPATAPLSNEGGLELAISPDGTRLAYVGRGAQSDRVALYVRDFDGLDARIVPGTEGTQPGAVNPFFSADGKWIGFNSPGQGIMRVAVSGGPPLKMLDDDDLGAGFLGAAWAADDTLIFSTTFGLNRTSTGGGGTPERLTPEPQVGGVRYTAPALLPGGRAVLFGRQLEGEVQHVAVLDLETGEQRVLIEGGQNANYAATGHIVFARGTTLMAVPFDLDRLAVTGEPVALLQGVRQIAPADYALSAGGTLVYVPDTLSPATGALVWVDRTGRVTEQALSEPVANPRDPRLSPDGRRLALTTGRANEGDLWIYDLGGRLPIPLADEGDARFAAWSPDGAQVAFAWYRRAGGPYDLYTAPADGSLDPLPLRRDKLIAHPAVWSEEGELILVGPPGNPPDIVASRAEPEAELRDVVATPAAEFDPALAPDGRWLALPCLSPETAASSRAGPPTGRSFFTCRATR